MTFSLSPDLVTIVRPGVLWLDNATVVNRDPRMDAPLAAAEATVRAHPPEEVTAVRAMYKRVGLDPTKTRPSCGSYKRTRRRPKRPTSKKVEANAEAIQFFYPT